MNPKNSALFAGERSIYLITSSSIAGLSHKQIADRTLAAGIKTLQLREKDLSKKEIFSEAVAIRRASSRYGATFIINDYVDIAMSVDADGVHLGQHDMPVREARKLLGREKIIGLSTHNIKEAVEAEKSGADYIGFGPIYHTVTKITGEPKGLMALKTISNHVSIPVVAIGGITWENIDAVFKHGADAVAVVSGILSGDIKKNIRKIFLAGSISKSVITNIKGG